MLKVANMQDPKPKLRRNANEKSKTTELPVLFHIQSTSANVLYITGQRTRFPSMMHFPPLCTLSITSHTISSIRQTVRLLVTIPVSRSRKKWFLV